jgi:hypothetical protein
MLEANAEHGAVGEDVRDKIAKCDRTLVALLMRLHVRLGRHDPMVIHFRDAHRATVTWQFNRFTDEADPLRKGLEEAWETFERAKEEFLTAAVSRAGTRTVGPFGKRTE